MEHYTMNLTLKVWRQKSKKDKGSFETYSVSGISSEMSFLEMFDVLNERLVVEGKEPIAFDHDCREGICGMCSMYINGRPHGPWEGTTTCQLHMRAFKDGDTIVVEPWRAKALLRSDSDNWIRLGSSSTRVTTCCAGRRCRQHHTSHYRCQRHLQFFGKQGHHCTQPLEG